MASARPGSVVTHPRPAEPSPPAPCPLFLNRISAGFPSPADDYVESALDLRQRRLRAGLDRDAQTGEAPLALPAALLARAAPKHAFRPLSAEEVRFILERRSEELGLSAKSEEFTDVEAMAAIVRITGGNFRLLNRLLKQARRIMKANGLKRVTKEVVEAARECLVIGPA